jgi:hypothetical protein
MPNGSQPMPNCVLGARRLSKGLWAAILWPVFAAKTFAICVLSPGSPTTRTILTAIFIRKRVTKYKIEKKKLWRE